MRKLVAVVGIVGTVVGLLLFSVGVTSCGCNYKVEPCPCADGTSQQPTTSSNQCVTQTCASACASHGGCSADAGYDPDGGLCNQLP